MDFNPPISAWVKARRKQLDLTQTGLAHRAHYSVNVIRKVEAQSRPVSRALAEALRVALEVPADDHDAFIAFARGLGSGQRLDQLPVPVTSLLGREAELGALKAMIGPDSNARLVTLMGPPGVGKTRLATQVALEVQPAFADGAAFVALAPLSDPGNVPAAIVNALRRRVLGGTPTMETIADGIGTRELLLVLDNFEHLLESASVVSHLLARCPRLRIVVTSRAILNITGEHVFEVRPLARTSAVVLFSRRAVAVKPAFAPTRENESVIGEICHKLDNLPLAIELAAARSRMLSPNTLLERLTHHRGAPFDLLTGGPRDAEARQRTLRATIDWSFALLDASEQRFLRRMGIFAGGCVLDGATAVCVDSADEPSAESMIQSLLEKSLIYESMGLDGAPRYGLLETIREYALLRLEASGETDLALGRMTTYLVSLGDAAQPYLARTDHTRWLKRLIAERDNIAIALDWSRAPGGDYTLGLRLASRIGWVVKFGFVWNAYMSIVDAHGWTKDIEARVQPIPPELRAVTIFGIGDLVENTGDLETPRRMFRLAGEVARRNGDRWMAWQVFCHAAQLLDLMDGDHAAAMAQFETSLVESDGEPLWRAQAQLWYGRFLFTHGLPKRAIAGLEEALQIYRAHGLVCSPFGGMAQTEHSLAQAHAWHGTFDTALMYALRAIDDYLSVGWPIHAATRLAAFTALACGQAGAFTDTARRLFLLPVTLTMGAGPSHPWLLELEAILARCLLRCAGAALAVSRTTISDALWPTALTLIGREVATLGDPAAAYRLFGAAWAHLGLTSEPELRDGTRLRLEDHRAKALADQTRFEPWRAGERMSLEEALGFLRERLAIAGAQADR